MWVTVRLLIRFAQYQPPPSYTPGELDQDKAPHSMGKTILIWTRGWLVWSPIVHIIDTRAALEAFSPMEDVQVEPSWNTECWMFAQSGTGSAWEKWEARDWPPGVCSIRHLRLINLTWKDNNPSSLPGFSYCYSNLIEEKPLLFSESIPNSDF